MNHSRLCAFELAVTLLALTLPVRAAPHPQNADGPAEIAITNPGFEHATPRGLPAGWEIATPAPEASISRAFESAHSGAACLQITHARPASSTLLSEPVGLRVGHLYRLSAWIRTEQAFSDATSRYPTAVPACLSMASFPFTNHSPTLGADAAWSEVSVYFVATTTQDRVRLHLGFNGTATGTAWFDDIRLDKVEDISEEIPPETVRWFGDGFRYDDRGWIFVHVEGDPYQRGYQYGYLVADEIAEYSRKLGVEENEHDPGAGWSTVRFQTDALFLRKYDEEYLAEMKGIADGAAHAGAKIHGRKPDFLDIVAINSVIDLKQLQGALQVTPHPLTGQSFLAAEDEMLIDPERHKCSAFAATRPATKDGGVVFGQIFMWGGYTGVHWNVICDVVPSQGHRLVYETFPGGIHSGADFYINAAGVVIGETTVAQTPFEPVSTPQSNRIRKAAQYAASIDDVVRLLWDGNNGMYTNDWPIADVKTGEVAILLLGTHRYKLWRTSEEIAPFGTPGFLWSNNNARDPEVRKEYSVQPDDRPFDFVFAPWNRDVAFTQFYQENAGRIDAPAAVNLLASSPVNRAHACDGKVTTSEMARELVFLAHHGKVTLREKFPAKGFRIMPDKPGATPHLSLGYSVASPVFFTEKLRQGRGSDAAQNEKKAEKPTLELGELAPLFKVEKKRLWRKTVYPHSDGENWFVSATAAYWNLLNGLDDDPAKAADDLRNELSELSCRYLYTVSREQDLTATEATRSYDRYGPYQIPRIKGTFALHQLRLLLGNETFLAAMNGVHDRFAGRTVKNEELIALLSEVAGRDLNSFIRQWIERRGLPQVQPLVTVQAGAGGGWDVTVATSQREPPYHLVTHLEIEAGGKRHVHQLEISDWKPVVFHFDTEPVRVTFNALNDFPVANERFYTWSNFIDDFQHTLIVYGTSREIEACHTLAQRWQTTAADAYVEILPPLVKDSELTQEKAASHDLMVLGSLADNSFLTRLAPHLPVRLGKNHFEWQGELHARSDEGLLLVVPNPFNPQKVLYLLLANSALELYQMTKTYQRAVPSWALFKGEDVVTKGYHPVEAYTFRFP
ncbi:MAG: C45 family autoproteolytic acyltransferase/hydrolase [Planctomycetota bacterium]